MIEVKLPTRIVNVASDLHSSGKNNFKLANVLFNNELARGVEERAVTANVMNLGMIARLSDVLARGRGRKRQVF